MSKIYPVAELGTAARVSGLAIVVLTVSVVLGAVVMGGIDDPMGIAIMISAAVVPAILLVLLMRRRSVALVEGQLEVKATFYTQRLSVTGLDFAASRVVSLDERVELRPVLRTNGFSLPGFHCGHYRLRDLTKAFCMLTTRERVLLLKEKSGRVILLSLARPKVLLDDLRGTLGAP